MNEHILKYFLNYNLSIKQRMCVSKLFAKNLNAKEIDHLFFLVLNYKTYFLLLKHYQLVKNFIKYYVGKDYSGSFQKKLLNKIIKLVLTCFFGLKYLLISILEIMK